MMGPTKVMSQGELSHSQARQNNVIPVSSSRKSSLTDVTLQPVRNLWAPTSLPPHLPSCLYPSTKQSTSPGSFLAFPQDQELLEGIVLSFFPRVPDLAHFLAHRRLVPPP